MNNTVYKGALIIKHTFKRALIIHYTLKRRLVRPYNQEDINQRLYNGEVSQDTHRSKGNQRGYSARWTLPLSISYCIILIVHLVIDTMADSRKDPEMN